MNIDTQMEGMKINSQMKVIETNTQFDKMKWIPNIVAIKNYSSCWQEDKSSNRENENKSPDGGNEMKIWMKGMKLNAQMKRM